MKKIILYISLCLVSLNTINSQDDRFNKANELFKENKFNEAVEAYTAILNSGVENSDLYYNLGNSYYKNGKLPEAILNFERALLLSPNDKDVRYNLEMANMQITDKLETVGQFFLKDWFNKFKNTNNSDSWAIISIITFALALFGIGIFFFSGKRFLKQVFFTLSIVFVATSLFSFNFSRIQKEKLTDRKTAIIFEPSINVKSSPSSGGTDLFILHEGTKIEIIEELGDWNRIVISDGNEGWMPKSATVVI